jgi:hypothetical protein
MVIPQDSIMFVPATPAVVVSGCTATREAVDAAAVCTLSGGESQLTGSVPTQDALRISPGMKVDVTFDGVNPFTATVAGVEAPSPTGAVEATDPASRVAAVQFTVDGESPSPTPAGVGRGRIVMRKATESSVVIPATSLKDNADGKSWVSVSGSPVRDVPVAVEFCVAGKCAVTGELREGERVVVSSDET